MSKSGKMVSSSSSSRADSASSDSSVLVSNRNRWLDSLANLFEGVDDKCGAVMVANNSFYFATNSDKEPQFSGEVKDFLKKITLKLSDKAHKNKSFYDFEKTTEVANLREALLKNSLTSKKGKVQNHKAEQSYSRALYKVMLATYNTYHQREKKKPLEADNTLQPSMVKAMELGSISYAGSQCSKGERDDIHAEMRLLKILIDSDLIGPGKEQVYIGISKKCCPNCEAVIKAINTHIKASNGQGIIAIREMKGGHNVYFDSAIPRFLLPEKVKKGSVYAEYADRIIETTLEIARELNRKRMEDGRHQLDSEGKEWPATIKEMFSSPCCPKAPRTDLRRNVSDEPVRPVSPSAKQTTLEPPNISRVSRSGSITSQSRLSSQSRSANSFGTLDDEGDIDTIAARKNKVSKNQKKKNSKALRHKNAVQEVGNQDSGNEHGHDHDHPFRPISVVIPQDNETIAAPHISPIFPASPRKENIIQSATAVLSQAIGWVTSFFTTNVKPDSEAKALSPGKNAVTHTYVTTASPRSQSTTVVPPGSKSYVDIEKQRRNSAQVAARNKVAGTREI